MFIEELKTLSGYFQQQRFRLGARNRGFNRIHLAEHELDTGRQPGLLLKVGGNALLDIASLPT